MVVLGGLAAWQWYAKHHETTALVLAAVGLTLGLAGLLRPEVIRPVFTVLIAVTTPIGRVVSLILLAAMFYGLFTPLAITFPVVRTRCASGQASIAAFPLVAEARGDRCPQLHASVLIRERTMNPKERQAISRKRGLETRRRDSSGQ